MMIWLVENDLPIGECRVVLEPEIRYQHARPNEQRKTVTENDKEQQHDGDEIQNHI